MKFVKLSEIKTQYILEGQLIALSIMLCGILVTTVFAVIFSELTTFMKWMAGINGGAGLLLLSSFWTATYQQLRLVKSSGDILESFQNLTADDPKEHEIDL